MNKDNDDFAMVLDNGQPAARAVYKEDGTAAVELAFRAGEGQPTALIAYMEAGQAELFAHYILDAAGTVEAIND